MKSTFTAVCIAAGLLGSSFAFAATPVAPAMQAAPMAATAAAPIKATTAVTKHAKKSVKKHASKKVAKKAAVAS